MLFRPCFKNGIRNLKKQEIMCDLGENIFGGIYSNNYYINSLVYLFNQLLKINYNIDTMMKL